MKPLIELQLDLIEIQAYRENQYYKDKDYYLNHWIDYIDKNELEDNSSEDAYFRMRQQNLEEAILYYDINNPKPINKRKPRLNRYRTKIKYKQKLKQRRKKEWDDSSQWWRIYKSSKYVQFYKNYANQKIRTTDKEFKLVGKNYRKIFDYWWAID